MLPAPLLAVVTLSLSDASTAEVRSMPQTHAAAMDLYTDPNAELSVRGRRAQFSLFYSPDLAWIDATRGQNFALLHEGGLSQSFWGRRWRLSAELLGAWGKTGYRRAVAVQTSRVSTMDNVPAMMGTNGTPAPVGDPNVPVDPNAAPPVQAGPAVTTTYLPVVDVLETVMLRGSLTLAYAVSRRWTLTGMAAYEVSGGRGASEPFLPLRRGPLGSLSAQFAATRRDDITSTVSGFHTVTPHHGGRFVGVGLLETWMHKLAPMTSTSLGIGATYLRSRADRDAEKQSSVLANGLATLTHGVQIDKDTVLSTGLNVSLSTYYNPVLGTVGQQLTEGAQIGVARDRTTVGANVTGGQSLPFDDPNATKSFGANAFVSYRVADPMYLRLGGGWTHQVLPDAAIFAGAIADQWHAGLTLLLAAPPVSL